MTIRIDNADVAALAGLVAVTAVELAPGLGPDGWHSDDAWVINSIIHADSFAEFIDLGFTHPGFNALIALTARDDVGAPANFQLVAFGAGMLGVLALFALAKTLTRSTLIGFIAALPLATSWLFFRYSNAVKPYTIELLVFALVLLALVRVDRIPQRLRRRWLPIWVVALVPTTFVSLRLSFVSVCAAWALWWCRRVSNRQLVLLATAHAALLGPWALFLRSKYNVESVKDWWVDTNDAFITWGADAPVQLLRQLRNASRVLIDLPGDRLQYVLVLLVLAGAIDGVLNRRVAETAAATGLGLAAAGSAAAVMPFGPTTLEGERIDLWLVPAFLVLTLRGAAIVLDLVASVADRVAGPSWRNAPQRLPTPVVVLGAALLVLVPVGARLSDAHHTYPHRNLEENLNFALDRATSAPGGVIVGSSALPFHLGALFPELVDDVHHNAASGRGVRIELQPGLYIRADRAVNNPLLTSRAPRVVLIDGQLSDELLDALDEQLRSQGFRPVPDRLFRRVEIWERPTG